MNKTMKIIFKGDTGQIDANTLIAAIGHYQFLMEQTNKELGGSKTVQLKVNAIERGSFVIDVAIVESTLKSLFSGDNVGYVASVITIVMAVYSGYKKLKGRPARTDDERKALYVKGDGTTVINQTIVNVYNQVPVREAINKTLEAADRDDSVEGMVVESEHVTAVFPRADFADLIQKSIEPADSAFPDKILTERATMTILALSFEPGARWMFMYRGFKIRISIKDGPLMDEIDRGARFGKGDTIEAVIEIVQRYNPMYQTYENVRYRIAEFIRHIPAPAPPGLFDT